MEELQIQEVFVQKEYFRAAFAEQPEGQLPPASLRIIESHGDQVAFPSQLLYPRKFFCLFQERCRAAKLRPAALDLSGPIAQVSAGCCFYPPARAAQHYKDAPCFSDVRLGARHCDA